MKFEATLGNTSLFKDSIETISNIIDEGIFQIDEDGISLMATDRAMVAVVDFEMNRDAFEEYEVEGETNIGLNMPHLVSILKRIKPEDQLILKLDEDDNKLNLVFKGLSERRFSVPIIDVSEDDVPPTNDLDFPITVELLSNVLKEGIADAEVVSDSVKFRADKDFFGLKAEGDMSDTELKLINGEDSNLEIEGDEHVESRYPIDYLNRMIKASKIAPRTKINLGSDFPLKLEFGTDKVQMNFVLAPRVEE